MNEFSFESYGVKVRVESQENSFFEKAVEVVRRTTLGRLKLIDSNDADHVFNLSYINGIYSMDLDGEDLGTGELVWAGLRYFDTRVRLVIAEHAVDHVFLHSGAVVWNGKAIIFPADSFSGKTTLVAEFVKKGAIYYSDEYAVLDANGMVHPFPRLLSMRDENGDYLRTHVSAESLGGTVGILPMPVSFVLLTKYDPKSSFKPVILSSGMGLMKMMPQAISLRSQSEFTLNVLKTIANSATIAESLRNNAIISVDKIIDFIDNM